MRLEIGAGNSKMEGFIHTDLNAIEGNHLEAVCRGECLPFLDESFEYVLMQGCFEHFTLKGADRLVAECWRVLGLGGRIELSSPDLMAVCAILAMDKLPFDDPVHNRPVAEYVMACLYGGQDRPGQLHKWGWTEGTLSVFLTDRGFTIESFDRSMYEPETHLHFIAQKREEIS